MTDTLPRQLPGRSETAHQVWTLVLVSLGLFMAALDTLVVTTALPVLRVSLHTSLSDLEWTVNAYNLAFACSLLTGADEHTDRGGQCRTGRRRGEDGQAHAEDAPPAEAVAEGGTRE